MITSAEYNRYGKEPEQFRDNLFVDVDGSVRRFGDVQDDWQRTDFQAIDPALLCCSGRKELVDKTRMRCWLERARGHSKTTDLSVIGTWLLTFANRPLRGYAFAADRDQAALLKNSIETLLKLNPWLSDILVVQNNRIVNVASKHPGEGSELVISTSDVGSSYGILPDFLIGDEVCHWAENQGEMLWQSLVSSAAKRANCFFACITNSGFTESWQWNVREQIRTNKSWYFSRLDGPQASWLTAARLEEQQKLLPPVAYRRLWLNHWSSGGGDALTEDDVRAAFEHNLHPMHGTEMDWSFVAGVDLGLKRDCSAVVVLGVKNIGCPGAGTIRLANTRHWAPSTGNRVDLMEVEDYLRKIAKDFDLKAIAYDPWQAEHLSQRLQRYDLLKMVEVPQVGQNMHKMASRMIESFTDRRILLYQNERLRSDLLKLRVEERAYGYRLVSPRDKYGHGDLASAFSLALLVADGQAAKRPAIAGTLETNPWDYWSEQLYARQMWARGIHPTEGTPLNDSQSRLPFLEG